MKKWVQHLYIIILALLIILPVGIFQVVKPYIDTANRQNRELAGLPSIAAPRSLNASAFGQFFSDIREFPGQFQQFFNDRLPFRNQLVFANAWTQFEILHQSSAADVIVGKDRWLFYRGHQVMEEDPVGDYMGTNLFTEEELQTIAANMVEAQKTCREKGCEFVVFIAPNKERIYSEYMPDDYGKPADYFRIRQVINYLEAHTDVPVVCPLDELLAYRQTNPEDLIYIKHDNHWNYIGTYIGSRKLAAKLGFDLPPLESLSRVQVDAPAGDLAAQLGLGDYFRTYKEDAPVGFSDHKINQQVSDDKTEFVLTNEAKDGDPKTLMVIGDSFATSMLQYVGSNYNRTYMNFYYNYDQGMLEDENPDIFVYESVERYLNHMLVFDINAEQSMMEENPDLDK